MDTNKEILGSTFQEKVSSRLSFYLANMDSNVIATAPKLVLVLCVPFLFNSYNKCEQFAKDHQCEKKSFPNIQHDQQMSAIK